MKKYILYLGLAAGLWYAMKFGKKAIAGKNLNVKIRTLKLNPISSAAVVVEIINPTNFAISFDSITTDCSIDGNAISTLNYQKNTSVPANSTININLPIQINPLESAMFLATLIKNKFKVKTISLTGTINGEGLNIPINITQTINA